ncbi:MAG TPA: META domain-containing protein [Xanthomonadales bacterium]|nr:META domain-containing protein [Xanthomonadales bacterium]
MSTRASTTMCLATALLAIAACADAETEPPVANDEALAPVPFDPNALAGREWRLVALPGPDEVPVPPGTHAMLRFDAQPDGTWSAAGYGPCNQVGSPVVFTGGSLELVRLASSKRACAELALETAWFERMRGGKAAATLDGNRLELARDGVAVMVFEAGPVD